MPSDLRCPCDLDADYAACCGRFHRGEEPPDPPTLMRSRYSAFARGELEYLWKTLHPEHPDRAGSFDAWASSTRKTIRSMRYLRLRILDAEGERVLFHATLSRRRRDVSFAELSVFAKEDAGWRYLDGATLPGSVLPRPLEDLDLPRFESLLT